MPIYFQNDTTYKLIKLSNCILLCDSASQDTSFELEDKKLTTGYSNTTFRNIGLFSNSIMITGPSLITKDGFIGDSDLKYGDFPIIDVPTLIVDLLTSEEDYGTNINADTFYVPVSEYDKIPTINSISLKLDKNSGLTGSVTFAGNASEDPNSINISYLSNNEKIYEYVDVEVTNETPDITPQEEIDRSSAIVNEMISESDLTNNKTINITDDGKLEEQKSIEALKEPMRLSSYYDFHCNYYNYEDGLETPKIIEVCFNNLNFDFEYNWKTIEYIGQMQYKNYIFNGAKIKWNFELLYNFPDYSEFLMFYQSSYDNKQGLVLSINKILGMPYEINEEDMSSFSYRLYSLLNNCVTTEEIRKTGYQAIANTQLGYEGAKIENSIKINYSFPLSTITISGERILS
jgi:hypothetical protein